MTLHNIDALLDALRTAQPRLQQSGAPGLADSLAAVLEYWGQTHPRILVLGDYNRGKSTLLNSLLGGQVLPMDLVPLTGAAIRIRYGDTLYTTVRFADGTLQEGPGRALLDMFGVLRADHHLRTDVADIEVRVPQAFLQSGVELVDLPGTNDQPEQEAFVKLQLLQADLVIFVLDGTAPWTLTDKIKTEEWLHQRGIEEVVYVVNYMNLLTDDDPAIVWQYVCDQAQRLHSRASAPLNRVYRVDALPALRAVIKGAATPDDLVRFRAGLTRWLAAYGGERSKRRRLAWVAGEIRSAWRPASDRLTPQAAGQQQRRRFANTQGASSMSASEIIEVIGFDFGDAETALSKVSSAKTGGYPEEIFCELALNDNGIIKTVVGYRENGDVVIGEAAAQRRDLKKGGLHVGFKTMPQRGDQEYKELARDFIDHLFTHLYSKGLVDPRKAKIIIGHPSKWKHIKQGEPVEVLENVVEMTQIGEKADFELVPESRGAMIEAIQTEMFTQSAYQSGWALVIDVGSSTSDFTAVNLGAKKSEPADYGEELGARLIDRAIVKAAVAQCEHKDRLEELFTEYPEERARFELYCREAKEKYFSGHEFEGAHIITKDGTRIVIFVSLNHETMNMLTSHQALIKIDGEQLSWRAGFKKVLQQVKSALADQQVTNIRAILLTGGASRMDFVMETCQEVFPELDGQIARSGKPQFTIANGLARWGRLQIQTDKFIQEVDQFCTTTVHKTVADLVDTLFERLASMIATQLIALIKQEFGRWKSGTYTTIAYMEKQITSAIEKWLQTSLPSYVERETKPWIAEIANKLIQEIKSLENRYGIPMGTLGNSLSVGAITGYQVRSSVNIRDIDVTGRAMGPVGNVVGVIVGLVTAVVALVVTPILLVIVIKIIAVISVTLAWLIAGILATNPAGWFILAALGITAVLIGAAAKELLLEKMKDSNLPRWARNRVKDADIHRDIDQKRSTIVQDVLAQFKSQPDLRNQIVKETTALFATTLTEAAEDARMLIN